MKFRRNKVLEKILEFTITHISQFQLRKYFEHKIILNFLSINLNMCLGCSKQWSYGGCLFEFPQHVLFEK